MGGEQRGRQTIVKAYERYLESRDVREDLAQRQSQHSSLAATAAGLCRWTWQGCCIRTKSLGVLQNSWTLTVPWAHPLAVLGETPLHTSSPCSCLQPQPCILFPIKGGLGPQAGSKLRCSPARNLISVTGRPVSTGYGVRYPNYRGLDVGMAISGLPFPRISEAQSSWL